jgi:hypothetical protein
MRLKVNPDTYWIDNSLNNDWAATERRTSWTLGESKWNEML